MNRRGSTHRPNWTLWVGLGWLLLLGSGCDWLWKKDGAYDPFRCEPGCVEGRICFNGQCIKLDGALADGVQTDQKSSPLCGNGVVDWPEVCDPKAIQAQCDSLGFDSGQVQCNSNCTFDTSGCRIDWVSLPAGTFTMGSPPDEPCRQPFELQRQVTLTRGFEIMPTEATIGQFKFILGDLPKAYQNKDYRLPVTWASWYTAAAFCNALSDRAGLASCYVKKGSNKGCSSDIDCEQPEGCIGKTCSTYETAPEYGGTSKKIYDCPGYRMPTEAEWEYAYRAGTTTAFYSGSKKAGSGCDSCGAEPNLEPIAWYCNNSDNQPHLVRRKQANTWGLYDMSGNADEWCHDQADATTTIDPCGPESAPMRTRRSGAYSSLPGYARAATRNPIPPSSAWGGGVRCVKTK